MEKINEIGLKKEDIVKINTDCIYIKNSNNYDLTKININPNNFKALKTTKGYKKNKFKM